MSKLRLSPLLAGAALAAGAAPGAQAAYGPENAQPFTAPGGYAQIATSRVLGSGGGSVHGSTGTLGVTVEVGRGTFHSRVQVEVVKPKLGDLGRAIHRRRRHDKVLAGVGIGAAKLDGAAVNRFHHAVKLALHLRRDAGRAVVLRFDAAENRFVPVRFTRAGHGNLVITTRTPGAYAVVLPPARTHRSKHQSTAPRHMEGFGL